MKTKIGALVSHQATTDVIQEEIIVMMYARQEWMEAKMNA
jgi:hypothetical protein